MQPTASELFARWLTCCRFKGLRESAPDAVVIAQQNGRILLANRQLEVLSGYRPTDLVDQPVELLIPGAATR